MPNISTLQMSQTDWLAQRQKGIGGSDVAAILGLSSWKTPLDIYEEKVSETPIIQLDNPSMKAGRLLESVVADWYAEESGNQVINDNKIRVNEFYPFLFANVDRIIIPKFDGKLKGRGVLECKTTSSFNSKTWKSEVDLSFYCQLQHYLNVLGYEWGVIAVLIDGRDFRYYEYQYDKDFVDEMIPRLEKFWFENVMKKIPPAPINQGDIDKLYPGNNGEFLEAGELTYKAIAELKEEKALAKTHTEKAEQIELQLKTVLRDADGFKNKDGDILYTYKKPKDSMKFEEKAFAVDYPLMYKQYLKVKENSRRFLIK